MSWFWLFRPWSYAATLVPFLLAAGLCAGRGPLMWTNWSVGLLSGLFLQATVNLLNTWGDERSGVDSAPGAFRSTPQVHDGLVSLRGVFAAAALCAGMGAALGLASCFYRTDGMWRFNLPLLAVGVLGALGATNYSTGLRLKYRGFGVALSAVMMCVLEPWAAVLLLLPRAFPVTVSPYGAPALLAAFAPVALLIGAVMHGNDMRDIASDRAAGIRTVATTLGPLWSLRLFVAMHALAFAFPVAFATIESRWLLLPLVAAPLSAFAAAKARIVYGDCPENPKWRGLERITGAVLLVFGVLYSLSLFLVR